MTDRISTADLRKLLAEYLSGSPKAAIDLDSLKHDLAAEVIELRADVERLREAMADLDQCCEWGVFSMDEVKLRTHAALIHKEAGK